MKDENIPQNRENGNREDAEKDKCSIVWSCLHRRVDSFKVAKHFKFLAKDIQISINETILTAELQENLKDQSCKLLRNGIFHYLFRFYDSGVCGNPNALCTCD